MLFCLSCSRGRKPKVAPVGKSARPAYDCVTLLPMQILTYTEAVKTVDHDKAVGKPNSLWIAFAKFYEKHGDVANARVIFSKAVQV